PPMLERLRSGRKKTVPVPVRVQEREHVPGTETGPARERLFGLLLAAAALQVPHLVQPLFAPGRLAGQPLSLLDQLADLLPALVADLRVELGAPRRADALAALLADLLVELVPAPRLDPLAPRASDLLVEGPSALLGDLHAALASGFCDRHPALLVLRHPCLRWLEGPPSRPPSAFTVSRSAPFTGCASCLAR